MDTRDTAEQAELRRAARQLARELGPVTVAGLDDATRAKRLAAAVRDAGWLELRDDTGTGAPLARGVEAAIVADALGASVADVVHRAGARRRSRAGPASAERRRRSPRGGSALRRARDGTVTIAPLHAVDSTDEPAAPTCW